jgi:hypothetical protein
MSGGGGGIDYSKWDHLDDSSSSSEEELPYPRVTRLEAPSQVSTKDGTISVQQTSTRSCGRTCTSTSRATAKKKEKSLEEYIQEWTVRGGTCSNFIYWSQDREMVMLRMNISPHVKGSNIDVTLKGAIPYTNRHCATISETCTLSISSSDTVILEGELPHAVYYGDEEEEVDWMLEFVRETKYLVITLYKATPMPNMTIWWKRPLTQFEEIDVDVITCHNTSFQEAWAEAHEQFKKKIAASKLSSRPFDEQE